VAGWRCWWRGAHQVTLMLQHAHTRRSAEAVQRAPISGLLWEWMYQQERNFMEFTERLLENEDWKPTCDGVYHSSSVTDMFSLFRQTMDYFFRCGVRCVLLGTRFD
jgi:hypothetical protein